MRCAISALFSFLVLSPAAMAGPCKSCNNGPNGKTGRDGEIAYGPSLIFHHPAPDGTELPVQVEITIGDSSARSVGEQRIDGVEKREEIVECPECR